MDNVELMAIGAGAWAAQKVFGKALEEIGNDMSKLYVAGREKLFGVALRKVKERDDGRLVNMRVGREVVWHGMTSTNEICAEYFGGILASSRSEGGEDDSALVFVDCAKSLASDQLRLHYCIYRSLQRLWIREGFDFGVGKANAVHQMRVLLHLSELEDLGIKDAGLGLSVLQRGGLLVAYGKDNIELRPGVLCCPYVQAHPTVFGIQFYAAAMNELEGWREFGTREFQPVQDIAAPGSYYLTLTDYITACRALEQSDDAPRS